MCVCAYNVGSSYIHRDGVRWADGPGREEKKTHRGNGYIGANDADFDSLTRVFSLLLLMHFSI